MRRNPHPISTLPAPRPSLRPGEGSGARRHEAKSPLPTPVSGKARELNQLVWLDLLVIGVLVLLLAIAKASL